MNYDSDGNSSSFSASTTSTTYTSSLLPQQSVKSRFSSQISNKINPVDQETQSTKAAHEENDNLLWP